MSIERGEKYRRSCLAAFDLTPLMPLITLVGLPSSGKTRWARRLVAALQERIDHADPSSEISKYKVLYHNDELLGISHSVYSASATEKDARGKQMTAVKRDLSRSCIVVLDSLNYIKGFRYQLHCEAKGMVTTHCIVQVMVSLEKALAWNSSNPSPWDPKVIEELHMRYEEPNGLSRWDSPLFNLISDYDQEVLPVDEIWNALILRTAPPPNAATIVKPSLDSGFWQELDRQTLEVLTAIHQHQQIYSLGGRALIDSTFQLYVEMPSTPVSTAMLQRNRRAYIALTRMRNVDTDRIKPLFVEYLNNSLAEE